MDDFRTPTAGWSQSPDGSWAVSRDTVQAVAVLPSGGTVGQVLTKLANGDVVWADQVGGTVTQADMDALIAVNAAQQVQIDELLSRVHVFSGLQLPIGAIDGDLWGFAI